MLPNEQVESLHPFFKVAAVEIFWNGFVQKLEKSNSYVQRLLVIASPGIFFFEKSLLGGFKVNQIVSFSEMKGIQSIDDKIIINLRYYKVEMMTSSYEQIIGFIMAIQNSLFDPFELEIPNDLRERIFEDMIIYNTQSPLCIKFLSLATQMLDTTDAEVLANFASTLIEVDDSYDFNNSIINDPTLEFLLDAICLDTDVKIISFSSVSFSQLVEPLKIILCLNRHITTINFNGIIFKGDSSELVSFFKICAVSPITRITFNHCELTSNKFTNFLLAFSKFKCKIHSIKCKDCTFSVETLTALFTCLFQSPSFPQLREFKISGEALPSCAQDLALELLDESKFYFPADFNTMQLISSKFNGSQLIEQFATMKNPITSLDVSKSMLKIDLSDSISSFSSLTKLDISSSWTTPESLISLFSAISRSNPSISAIIADHLHMSESNWANFYSKYGGIYCPSIRLLSWENNYIRDDEIIDQFFNFLKCMKNIIDLSLSNTINASQSAVDNLSKWISSTHIQRFVMRGYDKTAFNNDFVPVLQALAERGSVYALDVTGQGFGDEGIEIIAEMVKGSLTSLAFDEQNPATAGLLFDVLSMIADKKMDFALWPEENLKRAIQKTPIQKRPEIQKTASDLKQAFIDRWSREIHHCLSIKNNFFGKSKVPRIRCYPIGPILTQKVSYETLSQTPESIQQCLTEVFGFFREDALTTQVSRLIEKYMFNTII